MSPSKEIPYGEENIVAFDPRTLLLEMFNLGKTMLGKTPAPFLLSSIDLTLKSTFSQTLLSPSFQYLPSPGISPKHAQLLSTLVHLSD